MPGGPEGVGRVDDRAEFVKEESAARIYPVEADDRVTKTARQSWDDQIECAVIFEIDKRC